MRKWFIGSLFVLITGVIIAFATGFFTSSDTATRNVTITISGLPGDRTVDVWGSSFWGGSEKLASFQSEQTVQQLVVLSKIDKFEVKSPINETGIRYITEKEKYDLSKTENLELIFKKQYHLSLGTTATARGTNMGLSASALEQIQFDPDG